MPDHVLDRRVSAGIFDLTDLLGLLRLASLIGVLSIAVSQIFDPRYRDFPIATYILPATAFAIEGLRRQRWARIAAGPVEQFLCWALVIAAAAILLREGIENIQAIGFVIIMILLSLRIATAGRPVPVF
jgi:glucan 1,3-beta-glucosidase